VGLPSASSFTGPVDALVDSGLQATCDPTLKPGTVAFRKLLLTEVGGRDAGIERACSIGGKSEHKEGRAFDWGVNAFDPVEAGMAERVIAWLLASDEHGNEYAMLRRSGVQYIIWNRRIWSIRSRQWEPYTGPIPHTDHVHFTLNWPGAMAQTSLYASLGVTPSIGPAPPPGPPTPEVPEPDIPEPEVPPPAPTSPWGTVGAIAVGLAVGYSGFRLLPLVSGRSGSGRYTR